ncbi:MAG: hypothetical protein DRI97_11335 [Bacteroidetes bacterium]|nr:MAG: hypothetical protein DRI97_11335 [Bacteroidota bacterium]
MKVSYNPGILIQSLALFLILSCLSGQLHSQEQDTIHEKKNFLKRMDSITNWKLEKGREGYNTTVQELIIDLQEKGFF